MNDLTPSQQAVFDFVSAFSDAYNYGPTTREIQSHLGHASATTACDCLSALEHKGYISRLMVNGKPSSRAITILKQ